MDEKYISVSHGSARSTSGRGRRAQPARRRSRGRSVFWGIYSFVVVLSAIIVATYIGLSLWVKPPEQAQTPTPPAQTDSRPVGGAAKPDPNLPAKRVLTRRKNVYTFFLAATDKDGYRTDTMMVACYDIPNQKVGIVSIPRDTLTDRASGNPKLVYGPGGVKQRVEDVSLMLGIPIDCYVKVNLKGFISLVDYLDGVDFYIPCDMDYDDPTQDLHIHYKEGQRHLNGQEAMEVARFRKNNPDENGHSTGYSDIGRTQTQQKLLVALAKKVLSWGNLTRINGFVEIFNQNVDTDLALNDMLYFASQAVNIQDISASVSTATLEGRGDGVYRGNRYCYELDAEKTVETVNAFINPYEEEMTLEDMHLMKAESYK